MLGEGRFVIQKEIRHDPQFPVIIQVIRGTLDDALCNVGADLQLTVKRGIADDQIVGFEDSPRGLHALMGTRAKPVLVSSIPYPEIDMFIKEGALHYPTFEAIPHSRLA